MQKFADIYFHLVLKHTSLGYNLYIFLLFYVRALYVIAKQRIDSGFFLFQAEQKKKAEKKKQKKMLKTEKFMETSDDDFVYYFFCFCLIFLFIR